MYLCFLQNVCAGPGALKTKVLTSTYRNTCCKNVFNLSKAIEEKKVCVPQRAFEPFFFLLNF